MLLAAIMLIGMTACGSNNDADVDNNNNAEQGQDQNQETEKKDTFTVAISYMPDQLSPNNGGSDDYTSMTRPLYDRLFMENNEGGIDYYLADSLTISEDGKTYEVHIRDDANWSDGEPITAEDVEFTVNYSILKNGYSSVTRVIGQDATMEVVDS